ncbi:SPFH domain-containing protein [Roseovarius sp. 2305UL8-3]|uniref:SPFH domain-containing protein n=1 Tax=Roseovarius conchicola TaxID=3121636 RepID=UPI0035290986
MAQIKRYPFASHLRAEASSYVRHYRAGKLRREGRGLSFWFDPRGASIIEVPLADRELTFLVKSQSSDYQDLAVQGTVLWRVADAARLSDRIDFALDLKTGKSQGKPEDHICSVLTGLARQFSESYLQPLGVRAVLEAGLAPMQAALNAGFAGDPTPTDMGIEVIAVRVAGLSPSSELARALQAPTFESLQQKADEATFNRRALAVEKERAIAENELNTQTELAARKAELIAREDANARAEAEAKSAAAKIAAEGNAEAKVIAAEAESTRIRAVEQAEADMEKARMAALAQVDSAALYALAARDFATKLEHIDSITISPDMLAGLVQQVRSLTAPPPVKEG